MQKIAFLIEYFVANFMLRAYTMVTSIIYDSDILKIVIISLIVVFILAKIFSSFTKCIIIWGWWDLLITLIPGIIMFCYLYFLNKGPVKHTFLLNIVFLAFMLISVIISFIINMRNSGILGILFAIVSVITKIILIVLAPIVIVLYIGALSSGTPDKRYRDGTKGNERTKIVAIVAAIAAFFIINFIKVDAED